MANDYFKRSMIKKEICAKTINGIGFSLNFVEKKARGSFSPLKRNTKNNKQIINK